MWIHSKKVWLIRHCDKLTKYESPCCSSYGYLRSEKWGDYFETKISTPLFLMASDYQSKKECEIMSSIVEGFSSLSQCPKSQRMYITAQIIQQTLEGKGAVKGIDSSFCVGEESALVQFLLKREEKGDVLVVWEHNGIVDILRHFGFKLSKWKNQLKEYYELVFWVDIDKEDWGYDCYYFENINTGCSQPVVDWLGIRKVGLKGSSGYEEYNKNRFWMIVVFGFLVGCGIGLVVFLITQEVSSDETIAFYRKMPIYM
jgi:hypothetical protein